MNAEQNKLLEDILANQKFLSEILEAAKSKKEIPKLEIGDTIEVAEITWRKFKEDEKGSYMLADESIDRSKFGDSNNWTDSYIRENLSLLAEKIRKEIDGLEIVYGDLILKSTLSIGVSVFPQFAHDANELLDNAFIALQEAFHNGKNQVITSADIRS
jgi:hypothetical protein